MTHGLAVQPIPLVDLRALHAPIAADLQAAVDRVVGAGAFILGEEVRAFEAAIAERHGAAGAVGVASGSDALYLALVASGVGAGDEVITTALSFFATAGAIARVGARPVFVDIEEDGFNLDPERALLAIGPRTKAIIPVHLFGRCARIEPIVAAARARGIVVIEDAAQAIDARRGGRAAGSFGDLGCLSFHPSKNLGAWGDGGMVLCRDAAMAQRIERLRAHGADRGSYHEVGINSRLDALQAAVLAAKLPELERWTERRRDGAAHYRELLADRADWLSVPEDDRHGREVNHCFTVRCRRRDELAAQLTAEGIGTAIYYPRPLHLEPCFAHLGHREGDFPRAEQACREVLSLPVHPALSPADRERVARAIDSFYRGRRVR